MTIRKTRQTGIELTGENIQGIGGVDLTREGELSTDSSDSELKVHLDSATRTVVTEDQVQVLTNKTIDADLNTISDLELDNLKTGVLNVSTTLTGASDLQVASALAVKTYIDDKAAAQNEASEISYDPTASGLTATNVQAAIDEVEGRLQTTETGLSNHLSDTTDAHDASAISVAATGTLLATDVQSALIELESEIVAASGSAGTVQTNLTNHINDTSDAHDASAISVVPTTTILSTNVQSALAELEAEIILASILGGTAQNNLTNHINDATDAHDASAISSVASGNLAATDVQTALNELQSDIDLRVLTTGGSVITPTRLDVKQDTKGNLTTYALTATNGQLVFATDTKEYLSVIDGLLEAVGGGGSGIASVDILSAEIADDSATTDFTQTGLEIIDTPIVLHGVKSFRLQHATSIKSFKKIIAVDRKFRGKNNTISLDVASTATNANLNIIFRDETNSVDLGTSQAIATGSQAITATTANASASMNGMTNSVFNTLKVGMIVTGSAIPVGTTIIALNSATATATLSQNATGVSTGIRTSDLVAKKSFSVDIPANCSSFSWTISSVVEAATESYIDDVVVQLTSAALMSTSVTVPKNNDTEWATYPPTITGFGTPTSVEAEWRRVDGSVQVRGAFTSGTSTAVEGRFSLPSSLTTSSFTAIRPAGVIANGFNGEGSYFLLMEPSVSYVTFGRQSSASNGIVKLNGSAFLGSGNRIYFNSLSIPIAGWSANETESKTIPLTSSQLVQQADSMLSLNTANGYGSTNTLIRRFSNVTSSIGSDVNYVDSNLAGSSFVILQDGSYTITYVDNFSSANIFGISKNSVNLATGIQSIPASERLAQSAVLSSGRNSVTWSGILLKDDVIRPHGQGTASLVASEASFTIAKQGSLKQLNVSSDSKITIPTHQLRFEGTAGKGTSGEAYTVKYSTQAITKGDGFSVNNTNGTVITINKAGRLSISANAAVGGTLRFGISKNAIDASTYPANSLIVQQEDNRGSASSDITSVSGFTDVVVGDIIRIWADGTINTSVAGSFNLSLTENSINAAFSNVLPQWSQSDSSVRLNTANGYGSTNTTIRRFANTVDNLGTAITYADSATLGASFIINEDGEYNISYNDNFTPSAGNFGISKNSTQLTTSIGGITVADRLTMSTTGAAGFTGSVSCQPYLLKGDIIRAHGDGQAVNTADRSSFTISKVGKPNLSSVDVTSFVNMKTTDTEAIEALTITSTFGSTNTGVPVLNITKNTNLGVIRVDSSAANGTSFVALKDCNINISVAAYSTVTASNIFITRNATLLASPSIDGIVQSVTTSAANIGLEATASILLKTGDVVRIQRNSTNLNNVQYVTLTATADNNATASPTQQVSSDTMSFAFKATAIDPATDAIGTFNTYTYASGGTLSISASAPTQTVADMNVNGMLLTARAGGVASTTASPAHFRVFIGKGLKSQKVDAYASAAKVGALTYDMMFSSGAAAYTGIQTYYNETTGLLILDGGYTGIGGATSRTLGSDIVAVAASTTAYMVFNASKSPSLVTIPNLQQRVAYLSDVKASGTAAGASISGTQTRTLNTIVDNTGIVTSLVSNQFILPAGTYSIEASAPAAAVNRHKARIRNITDSTTPLIGSSMFAQGSSGVMTLAMVTGEITITSAKTFELQHYTETVAASNGLGVSVGSGDSEVYATVKITRIK